MTKAPITIDIVTVKPEFHRLTEDDVAKALASEDDTAVAEELARLLNEYSNQCSELMRQGKRPDEVLDKAPSCPLEKIALELVGEAVDTAIADRTRGRGQ